MSYFYSTSAAGGGPVADLLLLPIDEGSGTALGADVGPDATLVGSTGWSTTGGGVSASFAGGYLYVDSNTTPTGTQVTYVAWHNTSSFTANDLWLWTASSALAPLSNSVEVVVSPGNDALYITLYGDSAVGSGLKYTVSCPLPATGSWQMISVIADMAASNGGGNGTVAVYYNTTLQTNTTILNAKDGTSNHVAGRLIATPSAGLLDLVQFFDSALVAQDITDLYNAGRT
jgi:hypothetical protein